MSTPDPDNERFARHALSIYPGAEPEEDSQEMTVQAECACGQWEQSYEVTRHDPESEPRQGWFEHLEEVGTNPIDTPQVPVQSTDEQLKIADEEAAQRQSAEEAQS
jgi:hypothetical protein